MLCCQCLKIKYWVIKPILESKLDLWYDDIVSSARNEELRANIVCLVELEMENYAEIMSNKNVNCFIS